MNAIAHLPFFEFSVNFGGEAAEYDRVAAQMLLLEYKEKIVSSTSQQLDKFYENHKAVDLERGIVTKTRAIVGMLGKIFPTKIQLSIGLTHWVCTGVSLGLCRLMN